MLGPLEAENELQRLPLGGIKQRATLGLLLLQPNRVAATSQLVRALWPINAAPRSARKILHNAVWGLRRALGTPGGEHDAGEVTLVSQSPGYLLRVDPERIDLYRFQALTREGRAAVAAGSPEKGAALLRDGLSLWRGPALADLVEAGISWPELAAVQGTRLDAAEDYFDAELFLGNHLAVLGELETMAETQVLRERSCGQLMLALYRSGRQADALDAYRRWRTALVDKLGLEPGRELQRLQHEILTQAPALALSGPTQVDRPREQIRVEQSVQGQPAPRHLAAVPAPATRDESAESPPVVAERAQVTVLIIRADHDADRDRLDDAHERVAEALLATVAGHGGEVVASIGSMSLTLFSGSTAGAGHAERAVRAARAARDVLDAGGPEFRAAVATGEALVRRRPGSAVPEVVGGALLDRCESLLRLAPAGHVHVSGETRSATESVFHYSAADGVGRRWQLETRRSAEDDFVAGRQWDLQLLVGLMQRTRHREMPHLVTLLGEPDAGKTRFVQEFARRLDAEPEPTLVLSGTVHACDDEDHLAVHREMVASYCGITLYDAASAAREKLDAAVRVLVPARLRAEGLVSALLPLISRERVPVDLPRALTAWRQFLAEIAARCPLAVVVDQIHLADEATLDFVQDLTDELRSSPLLVVAVARPSLLRRRPGWAGGKLHATTIMLEDRKPRPAALSMSAVPLERGLSLEMVMNGLLSPVGAGPAFPPGLLTVNEAGW
ncbi:hypothetical protein ALI22I_03260 [Saccharothrix sp. ALI-22-I]|uniref:BTAD domain-containing putative transcriptional regulator n=1 Tax=Saccharothrix sp. ALI-22-I TaxID=1933778 RepID=UPI00097C092F|nr:BTAD domain-containing putative transcriptional regulator [Saccharothrix sp. ALI-22-I]ONI92543.1 hypothetical protein ALI22I_03260 [Saccharothrix sp. ALI-22-I]